MVHFPGLSSTPYGFRWRYSGINLSGFPHSDILGSKPVCGSPKLFAAYHVLHRLLAPRHSPHALSSLTIRNSELTLAGSRAPPSSHRLRDTLRTGPGPTRDSPLHTACVHRRVSRDGVLWSEKTTVCRIFSCKRTAVEASGLSAGGGRSRDRFSPLFVARLAPAPPSGRAPQGSPQLSIVTPVQAAVQAEPATVVLPIHPDLRPAICARRLVENTGLEPVTSWLQTRRSPS